MSEADPKKEKAPTVMDCLYVAHRLFAHHFGTDDIYYKVLDAHVESQARQRYNKRANERMRRALKKRGYSKAEIRRSMQFIHEAEKNALKKEQARKGQS